MPGVEPRDEGVGERRDRLRGHHALPPPGVHGGEQLGAGSSTGSRRAREAPRAGAASPPGRDGSGGRPVDARTQRSYGTAGPRPRISIERSHMADRHCAETVEEGGAQTPEASALGREARRSRPSRPRPRGTRRSPPRPAPSPRRRRLARSLPRRRMRVRGAASARPRTRSRRRRGPCRTGSSRRRPRACRCRAGRRRSARSEPVRQAGFSFFMAPRHR